MRDRAARTVERLRPSRRAVRTGALAGLAHLTLLVGLVVLTRPLVEPLNPDGIATAVTWLLLYAAGAVVSLDIGPAWLSPAHVVGAVLSFGAVVLVLAVAVSGQLDAESGPLVTGATNYLFAQLYILYLSGGAVVVVAVPVLLWVEHRVWLPVLVTGTVYGWALSDFWRQSQQQQAMAYPPPVTWVVLLVAFWFLVPLAAALAGAYEYHFRRMVGSARA